MRRVEPFLPEEHGIGASSFSRDLRRGKDLGLSLSHGIVERHGGSMTVASTERGTVFVIELPRDAPLEEAEPAA